jgi:hypothetical protein
VGDRQGRGASVAQLGHPDALLGGQHRRAEWAQDVVVGRGAGVAAGPEAVQHLQSGEGAQPVLGGVQVTEGQLGQPAGLPVGASRSRTTSGCRHLITACESATLTWTRKPP